MSRNMNILLKLNKLINLVTACWDWSCLITATAIQSHGDYVGEQALTDRDADMTTLKEQQKQRWVSGNDESGLHPEEQKITKEKP